MKNRFELGDEMIGIDIEKRDWIQKTFDPEHYSIYRDGFIIDIIYVKFNRDPDATLYQLRWPNEY